MKENNCYNKCIFFFYLSGRTISRAAYAKLQSAKFPPILDRFGKIAEVIDGNSYVKFDLKREENDILSCNQIIFQFLAFSQSFDSFIGDQAIAKPNSIFLTFQFYRFPEFKTTKLVLDKIIEDYSIDAETTPFILKTSEQSKKQSNSNPGYMVKIKIKLICNYFDRILFFLGLL